MGSSPIIEHVPFFIAFTVVSGMLYCSLLQTPAALSCRLLLLSPAVSCCSLPSMMVRMEKSMMIEITCGTQVYNLQDLF